MEKISPEIARETSEIQYRRQRNVRFVNLGETVQIWMFALM
jgi:hypothetical protein